MPIAQWKGNHSTVIRITAKANPKRPGSTAEARFSLYRNGMTVAQYVEACKGAPRGKDALVDIAWDSKRRFIELIPAPRETASTRSDPPL
jgi:hypothetical protein